MSKVSDKVGPILAKNEEFRRKLNSLVWSEYVGPKEFEAGWRCLMEEFGLSNHNWFSQLFEMRHFWISVVFSDLFMCGLLRTTSRSESENSLFGSFTNPQSSLVEFLMHFDSAIDAQRYAQSKLNNECEGYIPKCKTPLALERHAAVVYTKTVFYDVQSEICDACFTCRAVSIQECDEKLCYEIKDGDNRIFQVSYISCDNSAMCSCKMFERVGLLCRHIMLVFKDVSLDEIPKKFMLGRWTKDASLKPIFVIDGAVFNQSVHSEEMQVVVNGLWFKIFSVVSLAEGNMEHLLRLDWLITEHKDLLLKEQGVEMVGLGKQKVMESFCGPVLSSNVSIHPPLPVKNKGRGRRLKGIKEKAIEESKKQKRLCRTCNLLCHHDSRNCPLSM